jgi:hypothetical protein
MTTKTDIFDTTVYSKLSAVHDGYITEKVRQIKDHGVCYLFHSLDADNMLTAVELFTTQTVSKFLADYYVNHGPIDLRPQA